MSTPNGGRQGGQILLREKDAPYGHDLGLRFATTVDAGSSRAKHVFGVKPAEMELACRLLSEQGIPHEVIRT